MFGSTCSRAAGTWSARVRPAVLTPRALLLGYLAVHVFFLLFFLQFALHGEAFSDTALYRQWAASGFDDGAFAGRPAPWVYPILALLPIAIAGAFGPDLFLLPWVLMICVLNGLAVGYLSGWGKSRAGIGAAWWWLGFVLVMGTLGFTRVDGLTAPLVLIALVLGAARPVAATVLLSAATWMKVWPAAVVLVLLTVAKKRLRVFLTGIVFTAAVAAAAALLGVLAKLLNFLTVQGDRGMQLEATFTTPWLWMSVLHLGGAQMYLDHRINSMQVSGPGTGTAAMLMQPLLALAALAVVALLWWALHTGASKRPDTSGPDTSGPDTSGPDTSGPDTSGPDTSGPDTSGPDTSGPDTSGPDTSGPDTSRPDTSRPDTSGPDRSGLLLLGSLTMVTAFIVFNKVGSPQFLLWLGPVVAVGLAHNRRQWRVPTVLLSAAAVLTYVIYPLYYDTLIQNSPWMAAVLTVRNLLLVLLFCWSVRALYRAGRNPGHLSPSAGPQRPSHQS